MNKKIAVIGAGLAGITFACKMKDRFNVKISGIPSGPIIQFISEESSEIPLMKTLFVQEMAKQGVHMSTVFHPTMSHTEEDIDITVRAIDNSLLTIEKAQKSNFEDYLEAPILNEPFRRLVK